MFDNLKQTPNNVNAQLYLLGGCVEIDGVYLNTTVIPNKPVFGSLKNIIEYENIPSKFYLSVKACKGILRRKDERGINMNPKLELLMNLTISYGV